MQKNGLFLVNGGDPEPGADQVEEYLDWRVRYVPEELRFDEVTTALCPHCGAVQVFLGFSVIDGFICSECGQGVSVELLRTMRMGIAPEGSGAWLGGPNSPRNPRPRSHAE